MVRKFQSRPPAKRINQDLEKYRKRAIELGAKDAKVIPAKDVIIDERVLAKCTYPKCRQYGTNLNCPPHAMSPEMLRKVVNNFKYAIFLKMEVPPESMVGPGCKNPELGNPDRRHLLEIVAKIEAEAFYDGHHLAVGFAGGSCKAYLCTKEAACAAMTPGQGCRHGLIARSSMEAVGMDAFTMAAGVGWNIYPLGKRSSPDDAPYGTRMGIILIC
jgi:predicted metal-binding protein